MTTQPNVCLTDSGQSHILRAGYVTCNPQVLDPVPQLQVWEVWVNYMSSVKSVLSLKMSLFARIRGWPPALPTVPGPSVFVPEG